MLSIALIGLTVCNGQPSSILDDPFFIEVMEHLLPEIRIGSSKFYRDTVIPSIYDKVVKMVAQDLKNKDISIQMDGWTVNNKSIHYNGICCSFISTSAACWSYHNITLGVDCLVGDSAVNLRTDTKVIAASVNSILKRFDINMKNITNYISDGGQPYPSLHKSLSIPYRFFSFHFAHSSHTHTLIDISIVTATCID